MELPTVRRTIDLECAPDVLWRLVTDPDELSGWLGSEVALDLRPGGQGGLIDDDGALRRLAVREVVDGVRLAFIWWPAEDEASASEVTLTIEDGAEGSRLVVTETLAATAVAAASSWDARLISLWLSVCAMATV